MAETTPEIDTKGGVGMSEMEYNVCETCGACNGRAGLVINVKGNPVECKNCYETRKTGAIFIDASLSRTQDELKKTMNIINT